MIGDEKGILPALQTWPGKSASSPDSAAHPALYHMLDVAAVAEHLVNTGSPGSDQGITLLAALHDLGKIGREFKALIESGAPQVHGRHWELTEVWLSDNDNVLEPLLSKNLSRREPLYAAVAGHHGRPPVREFDDFKRMRTAAGDCAASDARLAVSAFRDLWPLADLSSLTRAQTLALSWWLPGFIATADWIGSNEAWFPPQAAGPSLQSYLDGARARAADAVAAAGLATPGISKAKLFDFALRPMQQVCADSQLREGPMLAILEDETGAGKTEAALLLAHRMMQAGKGRGLYIALPTMATADAMFARARRIVRRLYDGAPSLALAHGRAGLSEAFRKVQSVAHGGADEPTCADWLADDRRKALLADVGIGTVDQALLGILPTRHATMRLYGLSSKILIVDEVHEMGSPYMARQLCTLLRAQAGAGGSAILLTATLPLDLRDRLSEAFEEGAGRPSQPDEDAAYPALTIVGGQKYKGFPALPAQKGPVTVQRLPDPGAALEHLVQAAAQGAACVWVRNAVDDAISACRALRARGVPTALLHARYTLSDRKRIEAAALHRFGKHGKGREGHVLVATQVVESSLDLDFDVMVSDLAPVAALIQRAGRLWRHMDLRPRARRPVAGPVLPVVAPDPDQVGDARWLHQVLERGAWVYDLPDQWRTARVLFDTGRIESPAGLRVLIEAVHGAAARPVPQVLEQAETEALGRGLSEANLAHQNVIDLSNGYRAGGGGWDDREYPTRLGQPQTTLVLARAATDGLRLWAEGATLMEAALLSEVRASESRLSGLNMPDQTDPAIARLKQTWPEWKQSTTLLCPVSEDGAICEGLRYEGEFGLMFE